MKFNCYVKKCQELAKHKLGLDDNDFYVCGTHYDNAVVILNAAQDVILKEKRAASKAIRNLDPDKQKDGNDG